ncbi:MAG TPA: alpha/beta hydrolase [Pseudonocardiaceae bacterium]|jgi:pimeloyl-ACP methyl ester carboxylesterase|nr:alpha/beta hydrolase [Pseudonocardiaceae bacterium]
MPRVTANGLELEYETFGDPTDPPLVLIMGLSAQMTTWPEGFCNLLAEQGYHVIRFDNRDIGLSTYFDDLPKVDLPAVLGGDFTTAPYRLSDFADDTIGLLDALGIAKAHIVGASMGGMIAQQLTIDHPDRVRSLCSIMSTTGDRTVGQSTEAAMAVLLRPAADDRETIIANAVAGRKVIGSPGYPTSNEELIAGATAAHDRAFHPAGVLRQMAAVVASPDRTEGLHKVTVPTTVIHGGDDPLVNVSGGEATATAVPGASLLIIPGMGHDLPTALWSKIADAIVANAQKAD